MLIEVREQPFDPWQELAVYQNKIFDKKGQFGATASFVGTMRDFNEGDTVKHMTLEYYPGMTEKHLEDIASETIAKYGALDAMVLHRVGHISPGDPIVLVCVWSAHRAAAFDTCRHIMEDLKSKAPFWKKETLTEGARWVEKNTPA